MKRSLTFRYSLHQMAYWAAVAGVVSFASAYLLAKGFTAGQVGVLLAAGNLLSCTAQPLLAARADRSGGKTVFRMTLGLTLAAAVCFAVPELLALPRWAFGGLYLLGVFATDAMIPLMNAISVACNAAGRPVNYGFGRGMGSLAFSGAALAVGGAMSRLGAGWMIWISVALLGLNALIVAGYPPVEAAAAERQRTESCSLGVFVRRYRWYCVSLTGVTLLAMFHAMTENYLIEVVRPLGGDSGSVGVALFIATWVELPVLLWFDRLHRRLGDVRLLKTAAVCFVAKAVALLLAPSVPAIYAIELLQATTYAFLSPTQLYYANARVGREDMVKGQAFITAAYTLGCAAGNFAGGQLLQYFGVRTMLASGVGMALTGAVILFLTVDRRDS